jgi:hypothetical protein
VSQLAVSEGARAGAALGACVVVLAVIGLTPSLSWVPEAPLVTVAVLLPLFVYMLTGFRAGRRSRRIADGLVAAAIAGAISGGIGGLSYVLFGKSLMNIPIGLALGALGGATFGAIGAQVGVRRDP